ncbi:MAG: Membrane-associated zinc metalloprotease [Candidatus Beckwithbacteria bacterium GW2011_GWB1_47_15]|uniref:Membrane-associated zinc metalloprotease n=1 Tax=Candidatus Beckwithbacteria bacterium GW2011_GWB1_47_15 TaxID=1618371 RepID=A0A0G1RWE3_9BACT|nr:MAG: membrane-associated zinc metalloprotease, regulator of sigma E protease [Candidatus Beckwithbacteria bacterium GW2011_GWC1_49_16]KKU35351.1 MAG: Membrane-associated zinc metalloprotease [Candidatus Beckwithbacteria bacterium GW2011_GWA1_46_30]KKU61446.1 MAG: Membrane-associated zinc metalloprotease [Candidatus Beckwithbacteria bacterium GW2011_GWB1_47_15]KKU71853.1 MAG: Membrane-associated zinc metalloprotease [Candidatus Beckwithbacteria bacterium GW2011_GWA2_47_25]KKW03748.1 MAG: Memb
MQIIIFLIILSVLVLIHELGHFVAARIFGIKVEEFGLGYPPKVWGKKVGETIYSINFLPFGGFVRLLGENPTSLEELRGAGVDRKRTFFSQKKRVRTAVLTAGVAMNFLLGVILFSAIYTKIGIPEETDYLTVTGVAAGSPAEAAGVKADDRIVGVTGLSFEDGEVDQAFIDHVNAHRGEEIILQLKDGRQVRLVPRTEEATPANQGALGVVITNVDLIQYPMWQRPFRGAVVGLKEALSWGREILASLGLMVARLAQGVVPKDVAGPVGIYEISKSVSQEGILAVLQFMAVLSVNLAILNLLPLPALDGGRLAFVVVEAVTGKRVKPEVEQWVHLVGMVLLLGLMALVTIADIRRLAG